MELLADLIEKNGIGGTKKKFCTRFLTVLWTGLLKSGYLEVNFLKSENSLKELTHVQRQNELLFRKDSVHLQSGILKNPES